MDLYELAALRANVGQTPRGALPGLTTIRDAAVIGAVYAFYGGWAFITYYARFFGMPSSAMETTLYSTLTTAGNLIIFPYGLGAKVLFAAMVGGAVYAARRWPSYRSLIVWALALALFPLVQFVAYQSAISIASRRLQTGNFDRVAFEFRTESQSPLLKEGPSLCLIYQSSDRYYVTSCPSDPRRPRVVVEVRAADVKTVTVSSYQPNLSR